MSGLSMSLDEYYAVQSCPEVTPYQCYDIIILRKIENRSDEEIKNEKQNHEKNNLKSRWHHREREYSRYRNNLEERNCDKKPHEEPSGFKSEQSCLNGQPLIKQEKCNDNDEAQAEKNQGQSEGHQHQSEGNQDDQEGSQGQPEENRHHSEGSQGHLQRAHYQSKRSHGQSKRSRGQLERSHGQSERSRGQLERSHGQSERSHVQSERSYGQSKRSRGQLRDLITTQRELMVTQGDLMVNQEDLMAKQRDIENTHQAFMKNRRSENYKKQIEQRDNQMNMNRKLTPENEHGCNQNDRRPARSIKREIKDLLSNKYATTKSSLYEPKGVELEFNYQELGNQGEANKKSDYPETVMPERLHLGTPVDSSSSSQPSSHSHQGLRCRNLGPSRPAHLPAEYY
ncbi:LOW QUALITY PROTEIN: leucine zipper protein 4 [Eulemur rufifrons]|uniref:LOW QUALITY PROTEIN: leucine zipper protein 4 n=1 Tax=Eulemur rufifrons TaxID=859984 RepID=UPI003743C684